MRHLNSGVQSIFHATEMVQARQRQIVELLNYEGLPHALSGSNATYLWIENVDESAVRTYRNIELIILRPDVQAAIKIFREMNLCVEQKSDRLLLRDRPDRLGRWADRIFFAAESLSDAASQIPQINDFRILNNARVLPFEVLVEFQLARWSLDDRVDLRDMIEVGLLDYPYLDQLQPELAERLKELLDHPES